MTPAERFASKAMYIFDLAPPDVRLLTLLVDAWHDYDQARAVIAEHGPTFTDRFDQPRLRPETVIIRNSRASIQRLLFELHLGRPGGPPYHGNVAPEDREWEPEFENVT